MNEIDDMPQNDCPYWGTPFGYECPCGSHGVCFESSPCDGPDSIKCYDEATEFTEEHFKAVDRRMKIRKLEKLIDEYTEDLSVKDIHKADFAEKLAAYIVDKGGV